MIGEKIKQLREARGLTQVQLAEKAGISLSTLTNVEGGLRPTNRTKRALATALDVSLADLGGPNVARHWDELTEKEKAAWAPTSAAKKQLAKEKVFGEGLQALYADLAKKVSPEEQEILANDDYFHGFQEILWLVCKYKIEIPKI